MTVFIITENASVFPYTHVKSVGIIFDSALSSQSHVNNICILCTSFTNNTAATALDQNHALSFTLFLHTDTVFLVVMFDFKVGCPWMPHHSSLYLSKLLSSKSDEITRSPDQGKQYTVFKHWVGTILWTFKWQGGSCWIRLTHFPHTHSWITVCYTLCNFVFLIS